MISFPMDGSTRSSQSVPRLCATQGLLSVATPHFAEDMGFRGFNSEHCAFKMTAVVVKAICSSTRSSIPGNAFLQGPSDPTLCFCYNYQGSRSFNEGGVGRLFAPRIAKGQPGARDTFGGRSHHRYVPEHAAKVKKAHQPRTPGPCNYTSLPPSENRKPILKIFPKLGQAQNRKGGGVGGKLP